MIATYAQWQRWRSCTRKRQLTYLDANQLTLEAWRRGDGDMVPYLCEYATGKPHWHVGHVGERGAA